MYYYKSPSGLKVDLLFETKDTLYAIEVKSSSNPGNKDIKNLKNFETQKDMPVRRILFYPGEKYSEQGNVSLVPIAAIFRGK